MNPWLIVLIVIAAVLILLLIFAFIIDGIAFGGRKDKNPFLKYHTYEDFSLTCENISVNRLRGCIYRENSDDRQDENKIIIFAHGMGPGQIAYTTEIAYFCRCGYTVIALDSKGSNLSAGKSINGFYEGVKTVKAAIDFCEKRFSGKKIILVGHSWGAYSVLCASAERNIDGVVAISAPDSPAKMVAEQAAYVITRPIAYLLCPFLYIVNFLKFGIKGNANSAKCASVSGKPTLLVHGDCDKVVPEKRAAFFTANGGNITKLLVKGKRHNPYNTVAAEDYLDKIITASVRQAKITDELKAFFESIDLAVVTEEDQEVMGEIEKFIKSI